MKGWVYVISNKAMPGLIKVGFTLKDPALRALELSHTGSPHPYTVDYEVLINDPRKVEQTVHLNMKDCREGKEWFRCTTEAAIVAIQAVAGADIQVENFKLADKKAKVEEIYQLQKTQQQAEERKIQEAHLLEEKTRTDAVARTLMLEKRIVHTQELEYQKQTIINEYNQKLLMISRETGLICTPNFLPYLANIELPLVFSVLLISGFFGVLLLNTLWPVILIMVVLIIYCYQYPAEKTQTKNYQLALLERDNKLQTIDNTLKVLNSMML